MLTGENGIINQAQNAKSNSSKAEFEEKVKLAVTASRINEDGTRIDLSKLDSELKNNAKIPEENIDKSGENEGLPWIVTEKDYMYLITEEGNVMEIKGIALDKSQLKLLENESKTLKAIKSKDVNGEIIWSSENISIATVDQEGNVRGVGNVGDTTKITAKVEGTDYSATCDVTIVDNWIKVTAEEIAANPDKYYGKEVNNYTAGGATYKVFFVDTGNKYKDGINTVYLKADYDENNKVALNDYAKYNKETTRVKEMNPDWAASRGSNENLWNINEQAAAWLCTPAIGRNEELPWSEYYESGKANYVIGGPSAEMFVDSYNSVLHTNVGNNKLGTKYRAISKPGYVYTANDANENYVTIPNTIDYNDYGSMYCGKDGVKVGGYWWLASPSSFTSKDMCNIYCHEAYLDFHGYSNNFCITPLVSLKSDFEVQISYK